jgi:hypothetical protein
VAASVGPKAVVVAEEIEVQVWRSGGGAGAPAWSSRGGQRVLS